MQPLQALLSAFDRRGLLWKSGAAGAGIILAGSLVAALFYRGRLGEAYNPLNHFVSELGEVGISTAAWVFNGGLLIGGVLLMVFLAGLGRRIGGWLGAVFGALGLACGICGTAVGAVPMNDLLPHIFWARSFFNLGLGTMLFFSVIALLGRPGLSRRLAIPGIAATAAFGAFLAIPQPTASAGGDILAAVTAMLNAPARQCGPRPYSSGLRFCPCLGGRCPLRLPCASRGRARAQRKYNSEHVLEAICHGGSVAYRFC